MVLLLFSDRSANECGYHLAKRERFCIDWPPSATLFPLNRLLVLAGCLEHERLGTYIRLFPISRMLPEDCLLRKIAISASESACSFRLAFLA